MNRTFPSENFRPARAPGFFSFFFQAVRAGGKSCLCLAVCLAGGSLPAETNSLAVSAPPFPEAGASLLRVTGALALVLGLFLGGVWLFKNWQRLAVQRGGQPKLNILETRSLGARQAVFVVGYERQRFLVAASPAGVNLLSHLPEAESEAAEPEPKAAAPMPFTQALAQVLKRK